MKENSKKGLWQFIKFFIVSSVVGILQLVLANVLPLVFDGVTAVIPPFLQTVFDPDALFDVTTEAGAEQAAKYVIAGAVTWGYVLPFFFSNALANVYGYFQNRKTTFKSDAPKRNFYIYFVILAVLILFTTWLQGVMVGWLGGVNASYIRAFARTVASAAAGTVQLLILYPLEKFILLKEKKS